MARDIAKTQPQSMAQSEQQPTLAPACDIYENKDEILLVADLPGVQSDGLTIQLDKGELSLSAKRATAQTEGISLGHEYRAYDYRRRFAVPSGIDRDKITAELRHGVLRLRLPKSDALKPRAITVRAG